MPLNLLLTWYNLIFIIPFGLALFYLGLFVFTGMTFGDADADADVDADTDADVQVEAHVDVNTDADADHDVEGEHDADAGHESGTPSGLATAHSLGASVDSGSGIHPMMSFLSLLGVGKIPLSLALMTLMFCWGIFGFALNSLLFKWMGDTALIALISLPLTLIVSLALTGVFAALIAKLIPSDESIHERRSDLVGKPGEAMYDINAEFGMAMVRGAAGDVFQVPCRTAVGKARIPKGARIVLFDYDREKGIFQAAPFEA